MGFDLFPGEQVNFYHKLLFFMQIMVFGFSFAKDATTATFFQNVYVKDKFALAAWYFKKKGILRLRAVVFLSQILNFIFAFMQDANSALSFIFKITLLISLFNLKLNPERKKRIVNYLHKH